MSLRLSSSLSITSFNFWLKKKNTCETIVIVSLQILTMKSVYTADPFSTHTIGFVSALTSIWDFDLLMAAVKVQSLTFEASCEEQGDP